MYPLGVPGAVECLESKLSTCLLAASLVGECAETLMIKLKLPQRESEILFCQGIFDRFYSDTFHDLGVR